MKKLTSIIKEKFNTKTTSKLTLKEGDTLLQKFKKISKYIIKNNGFSELDIKENIVKYLEIRYGREVINIEKLNNKDLKIPEKVNAKVSNDRLLAFKVETKQKRRHGIFDINDIVFISLDNKLNDDYYECRNFIYENYKRFLSLNLNILGDVQLLNFINDSLNATKKDKEKANYFLDKYYKNKDIFFNTTESKYMKDFLDFLLTMFYSENNLEVMEKYNTTLEKTSNSRAFEDKKSNSEKYKELSQNSSLNKILKSVEYNDNIKEEYISQIEEELTSIINELPKTKDFHLRFRKLGKYSGKMLINGIYFPTFETICIDVGHSMEKGNKTLESFIHEYGHHIDYTFNNESDIVCSLSEDFRKILVEVQKENLELLLDDYYSIPSEIFARAFEIYMHKKGIKGSFIKDDYSSSIFKPLLKRETEICEYFDNLLK